MGPFEYLKITVFLVTNRERMHYLEKSSDEDPASMLTSDPNDSALIASLFHHG